MSETIGSSVRVRWAKPDRLNPRRTGKQLVRITVLAAEVGTLWEDALEAGVYTSRSSEGRPSSWEDTDPTSRAALSRSQRAIRGKVKAASVLVEEAVRTLEEAASVLTDGFLLTDEDVLERFLEKRRAATQD